MVVSRLGFEVDSSQAGKAAVDLDKLASSAGKAEKAERSLAGASKQAETATAQLARQARDTSTATAQLERSTDMVAAAQGRQVVATRASTMALQEQAKAARHSQMMNRQLMFQMVDVGQALATAPMMGVYALQNLGFQIAQIGQLYAGNGGFSAALRDSTAMVGRFAARMGPAALAVGAVAAALAGMQHEINKTSTITVSFGDVALATFQVIRDGIYSYIKPGIDAIAPWFASAWDIVVSTTKETGNNLIRLTLGSFEMIKTGVMTLPDAFIVAGEAAANGFIQSISWMVREAVVLINGLLTDINGMARQHGLGDVVKLLDMPKAPGRVDMGGAAAATRMNASWQSADARITDIMNTDYMGRFFNAVSAQAQQNARDRADEDSKTGGRRGGGKSAAEKMAEDYDKLVRSAKQFIAEQELEQRTIGMTEEAASRLRYEQELLNKAANDNINLTPRQRAELQGLAGAMASAEAETNRLKDAFDFAKETTKGFFSDFKSGLQEGKSVWESFANAASNALDRIIDKLLNNFVDAIFTASSAANGLGGGGGFGGLLGGIFSWLGFAKGGAFSGGNVIPFATGGVVTSPTTFPMSGGRTGLMGEAGPEAIMPLKRGPDGRLGVSAARGGGEQRVKVEVMVASNDEKLRVFVRDVATGQIEEAAPRIVGTAVQQSNARVVPEVARYQMQQAGGDYRS